MKKILVLLLLSTLASGISACAKKEADKPAVKMVNVTTAAVVKTDLSVVESAVGNATSLGVAQALDPTQVRRQSFTIRLPFPEHVARQLRPGQHVRLSSFSDPGKTANATIQQIRPALDSSTQTMEVIAALPGGHEWYSVGSVRGEVVLGVHRGTLVVPETAVVLRPAGSVVYRIEGDTAHEQVVKTGILRDGRMEILSGLKSGETIAVDGAGLLSEGAKVRIMNAAPAAKTSEAAQP
ncbi:MAG TPA: hypothetical protein DIC36_01490 [Gammaproteobacteria bacterium]|nr:hypothetical protein [Gammaproteobacteria bacterium]